VAERMLVELADVLRAAGLDVVELDGWQTRARGSGGYDDGRPTHVMVHHTASPPSSSGRPDAEYCAWGDDDAPLSNLCLDRAGVWWVLAAGATNTNGKGGPLDGVPADSMNTHAIGVEANGGYGEAWPKIQTDSYVHGVAALMAHYRIDHCRAHFEWAPDRKIDPAGPSPWAQGNASWNMDAFRADCEGGDMPLSDDDVRRIADAVWTHDVGGVKAWSAINTIKGTVRQFLGGWKDDDSPPPEETLLKQIHNNTR
jgi:N-acetylmuramoyl-L-alanine amidase